MESALDRAANMANTQLTKMRWALGLNGLLAIAVGVVILVWPGISLFALTILFGAYSLATGVVGLGAALSGAPKGQRGWLVVSSLLGIAVGVIVFVWPDISALALLYVIGAYAVALGIIAIAGAFYLPLDGGDTALMVLSGIVSILFGIVIFAKPGTGALVVLALIAAFALVTGITEVIVAIGAKRILSSGVRRTLEPDPHPSST
ncbi:MAG TPA: HdeD family acid-resistance protein [Gaiellaceae bacterium]|nr:HdeD family acid-resistance protein [Gaiellaceae bacterium]